MYILFSAELCHLICSIFSKNPFLSTTRERGFNFVHRSFQFPNVYTQNHCFSPPWYVLEDKAATWDESSSRSVLSNLQTLQFLFISWMGIWRQRCHLPVHEQTVSDKYQITTLVREPWLGILKKTHILKPDNVVSVRSTGHSTVQINIAPFPVNWKLQFSSPLQIMFNIKPLIHFLYIAIVIRLSVKNLP